MWLSKLFSVFSCTSWACCRARNASPWATSSSSRRSACLWRSSLLRACSSCWLSERQLPSSCCMRVSSSQRPERSFSSKSFSLQGRCEVTSHMCTWLTCAPSLRQQGQRLMQSLVLAYACHHAPNWDHAGDLSVLHTHWLPGSSRGAAGRVSAKLHRSMERKSDCNIWKWSPTEWCNLELNQKSCRRLESNTTLKVKSLCYAHTAYRAVFSPVPIQVSKGPIVGCLWNISLSKYAITQDAECLTV